MSVGVKIFTNKSFYPTHLCFPKSLEVCIEANLIIEVSSSITIIPSWVSFIMLYWNYKLICISAWLVTTCVTIMLLTSREIRHARIAITFWITMRADHSSSYRIECSPNKIKVKVARHAIEFARTSHAKAIKMNVEYMIKIRHLTSPKSIGAKFSIISITSS